MATTAETTGPVWDERLAEQRNTLPPLTVHGRSYKTLPAIAGRIAELAFWDATIGASDGRETERRAIFAALIEACGGGLPGALAVKRLLGNATFLGNEGAPILPIEHEFRVVRP